MTQPLILGTRPSKMAMVMAGFAKKLIESQHPGIAVDVRGFQSEGDKFQGDLKLLGGKGAFSKDLEVRLLNGEIGCAIHCLKDVPGDTPLHPDLELFCFFEREDPRDALIMRQNDALPTDGDFSGKTFATSSPRRHALLKHLYPGANVIPLRGNVDTRMRKLMEERNFDGMVLSYAGLERLELEQHVTKIYEPEEMLPAVGQGVLCLQIRREDATRLSYLRDINSTASETAINAERSMLRVLHGNCYSAIAGHCVLKPGQMILRGLVASPDGSTLIRAEQVHTDFSNSTALGENVARSLLDQGAGQFI